MVRKTGTLQMAEGSRDTTNLTRVKHLAIEFGPTTKLMTKRI